MLTLSTRITEINGHTTSAQSMSDSSDIDAYGGSRRAFAAKSKQRRLHRQAGDTTPALGEVRFSTRKAAKVSNYNEDNDEDFGEDEDQLQPVLNDEYPEEYVPAIDSVLSHRFCEGTGMFILKLETSYSKSYQGKKSETLVEMTLSTM